MNRHCTVVLLTAALTLAACQRSPSTPETRRGEAEIDLNAAPATGRLTGIVRDDAGAPVANARVEIWLHGARATVAPAPRAGAAQAGPDASVGHPGTYTPVGTAITDASGSFAIANLPNVAVDVFVQPPAGSGLQTEWAIDVRVPADGAGTVNVRLRR